MVSADEWRKLLSPLEVYLSPDVGVIADDVEEGERVLIVEERDCTADEIYIDAIGMTVAEANPEYPDTDRVYSVVYLESLPDEADRYTPWGVAKEAKRQGFSQYDFPESRLSPVSPGRITVGDFDRRGER